MRRPGRVRDGHGVHGYVVAPALAWAGWRLRVPGGPEGGQYHGYTGDDSDQDVTHLSGPESAWNPVWGGIPLREGETVSDYVYRSPGEVRPRPNASGGANVLFEFQTKRSPGYAVAPGNYRALGRMISLQDAISQGLVSDPCSGQTGPAVDYCRQSVSSETYYLPDPAPIPAPTPVLAPMPVPPPVAVPVPTPAPGWPSGGTDFTLPAPPTKICPMYSLAPCPTGYTMQYSTDPCHSPVGCAPSPNMVAQPSTEPTPGPVNTIMVSSPPPVSPSPAPTVQASPADYLPGTGLPLPSSTAVVSSGVDIGAWLTSSTIWSVVPNWVLVAGGVFLLFRGRKK